MTSAENISLAALTSRVSTMEREVKQLRDDFDSTRQEFAESHRQSVENDADLAQKMGGITEELRKHVRNEDKQYTEQKALQIEQDRKITQVQDAVTQIAADLKEPLEVYKVAKYGAKGTQLLASFIKSIWPLVAGILLGVMAFQYKATGQVAVSLPQAQQGK